MERDGFSDLKVQSVAVQSCFRNLVSGNREQGTGEFAEEVNVVAKAASRKPVTRMNTLRIGNAFEVKVLNIEARMEQGKDDGGRYWKLYW